MFSYIRDRIDINSGFVDEIRQELAFRKVNAGTALCFVAREIVHASKYDFKIAGYPLIFIADTYDGNGGSIDTTDYGWQAANGGNGKVGANGAPGEAGRAASSIMLIAQRASDGRLIADGRAGGNGGNGGAGEKGADGDMDWGSSEGGHGPVQKPRCIAPGEDGGNGGNGGRGGNGGDGGIITVQRMTVRLRSNENPLQIKAMGGAAGKGGAAGAAGAGGKAVGKCPAGKSGSAGKAGLAGKAGAAGKVTQTTLQADAWWATVVEVLGTALAQKWASYRTRVGEYAFRRYVPKAGGAQPARTLTPIVVTGSLLSFARHEFNSGTALAKAAPGKVNAARAGTLAGYLSNGLSPIGISYQKDLRPDFSFYEDFLTDYQGVRESLFGQTLQLLLDVKNTSDKSKLNGVLQAHAAGMSKAAEKDSLLAGSQVEEAKNVLHQAKNRLSAIQAELEAVRKAREEEAASFDFGDFLKAAAEVVGAVIAIVGAVYSAGTSIAAYVSLIGTVAATAADLGEAAADIGSYVDLSDLSNPKLTPAGEAVTGDLKKAIEHTAKLVDAGKAVVQLFEAKGDDKYDEKERELLVKAFDTTVEVNLRTIDVAQGVLAAESAKQKWDVYQSDSSSLNSLKSGFEKDMDELVRITRTVLRQFQTYVDHFIAYGFCRQRAFDLYTLPKVPKAPSFPFDYGYLHPDGEEDAFFALGRRDSSRVLSLVQKYVTSLAGFDPAQLREDYDQYWTDLAFDGHIAVSVSDPHVLKSLKGSGIASLQVDLSKFDHPELKVVRAEVALIGAKTNANHLWVEVELEHCGPATNRRRDNSIVQIDGPPRAESSPAQIQPINPQDLNETEKQVFWGRSPAARWRVSIKPEKATDAGLDLSGLTEVQLSIKYAYYVQSAAVKARKQI